MRFNDSWIYVFDKKYAYNRVKQCSDIGDIPDLTDILETTVDSLENTCYDEGKLCNTSERYWCNYPKYIAILNMLSDEYELQLYSKYRVGKLYKDIRGNKKEIRAFFEKNKGDVILLENRTGYRQIKPDYTSLLSYIETYDNLIESSRKCQDISIECRNINNEIASYKEKAQDHSIERRLNYLIGYAEKYKEQVKQIDELFNKLKTEKLNDYCEKISNEEAYGIIFALFYSLYLEAKRKKKFPETLKSKFNLFITKHPEAIDYFCEILTKGRLKKDDILAELKKDVSEEYFYSELAASILSW